MSRPIILTPDEWNKLKKKLIDSYPPGVMLIRSRMKKVLGFTVREHARWINKRDNVNWEYTNSRGGYYYNEIHLDFYDEAKRTFFILKYMNTD